MPDQWNNKLYFGDNLKIMREHIPDESVDLIYLDPPFNSKATYNVLFAEKNGGQSAAQITAFEDTWHWDMKTEEAYHEIVTQGPKKLADLIQALRSFLGQNDMMAYLVMMAIRLVEMHRVLNDTGSIYLHCDPTASHYLKLVLDAICGPHQFRNEITWQRTRVAKQQSGYFGKVRDVIFLYGKERSSVFNNQYVPHPEAYIKSHYSMVEEGTGRLFGTWDFTQQGEGPPRSFGEHGLLKPPLGKHWIWSQERIDKAMDKGLIYFTRTGMPRLKRYLDESKGQYVTDLWSDIYDINAMAQERLGYPTQKPETLLERIIKASSNEGDIVMDPFCGCGTTVSVAERLNRKWIGIDITHLAITLMKHRLEDAYGKELTPYEVIGDPKDLTSAKALAKNDRYQFEWWALGEVAARPAQDKKKGADSGVDGYIYFFDDNTGKAKKIIVQVKSGHVKRDIIATLNSDRSRENAEIGVLLTLEEPTRPMKEEAATVGFYEPEYFPGKIYPRVQIFTVEELLTGKELQYPKMAVGTFKKAERKSKGEQGEQKQLF